MAIELRDFDPADFLDEEGQTELLDDAITSGDAAYLAHAIGTIARAKGGLLNLERRTGIKRQTLAKSLGRSGNPTLETLLPVLKALGLKLTIIPEKELAA
jgi:probable addiction module antidote protein